MVGVDPCVELISTEGTNNVVINIAGWLPSLLLMRPMFIVPEHVCLPTRGTWVQGSCVHSLRVDDVSMGVVVSVDTNILIHMDMVM